MEIYGTNDVKLNRIPFFPLADSRLWIWYSVKNVADCENLIYWTWYFYKEERHNGRILCRGQIFCLFFSINSSSRGSNPGIIGSLPEDCSNQSSECWQPQTSCKISVRVYFLLGWRVDQLHYCMCYLCRKICLP